MTKEDAIRWLEDIHRRFNPTGENLENEGGDVHLQALDMGIEALSAVCDDCIWHVCNYNKVDWDVPSAEAVEVVRCGECKHMIADGRCMEFADDGIRPSATDYCSYGERKGGDK